METTEVATVFAPWLDLLPDDVDPGYVAAVQAEARATARAAQFAKITADLEAQLAAGAADPTIAPASLLTAAAELAAARTLATLAPPIVRVPQAKHDFVASMLPRPNPAAYRLPSPPAYIAQLCHHQRVGHARNGELPPTPTDLDVAAIEAYTVVAAQAHAAWDTLALFDTAPQGPQGSYVQAWHATVNDSRWPALRSAINDLIEMVNAADDARPPSGSCQYGPHSELRVQPAQPGDGPWTFASAVRDGIMLASPAVRDEILLPVS